MAGPFAGSMLTWGADIREWLSIVGFAFYIKVGFGVALSKVCPISRRVALCWFHVWFCAAVLLGSRRPHGDLMSEWFFILGRLQKKQKKEHMLALFRMKLYIGSRTPTTFGFI